MDDQRTDREGSDSLRETRFSLTKILACCTLIAVGLTIEGHFLCYVVFGIGFPIFLPKYVGDCWFLFFMSSGPMIGIGIFWLYRWPIVLGFTLGFVIQCVLLVLFVAYLFRHG